MSEMRKPILDVLQRKRPERVPFWLMRQAGRYLPEYLELRAKAGSFLGLVYNPEMAAEVTVQPLRRFGMDAAILFSDILVVPHALGQSLAFETGEGPKLEPIRSERDFLRLNSDKTSSVFSSVYETVSKTSGMLKAEGFLKTALIGFCGSPWTVICYMVEGRGSKDFQMAKDWALRDPASFQKLVDIVTESSCAYLAGQVKAGAEVIQLFESWAGLLDGDEFRRWIIEPNKKIRAFLKNNFPDLPVIGFPRGAGPLAREYVLETGIDCVGLDPSMDPAWVVKELAPIAAIQGNLAPEKLLEGGAALEHDMTRIQKAFAGRDWIFNLGHGVIKETPVEHVKALETIIRGWAV
jgi:uroporphyrinogen decarboxylase